MGYGLMQTYGLWYEIPTHQVGGLLRVWVMRGYGLIGVWVIGVRLYLTILECLKRKFSLIDITPLLHSAFFSELTMSVVDEKLFDSASANDHNRELLALGYKPSFKWEFTNSAMVSLTLPKIPKSFLKITFSLLD